MVVTRGKGWGIVKAKYMATEDYLTLGGRQKCNIQIIFKGKKQNKTKTSSRSKIINELAGKHSSHSSSYFSKFYIGTISKLRFFNLTNICENWTYFIFVVKKHTHTLLKL